MNDSMKAMKVLMANAGIHDFKTFMEFEVEPDIGIITLKYLDARHKTHEIYLDPRIEMQLPRKSGNSLNSFLKMMFSIAAKTTVWLDDGQSRSMRDFLTQRMHSVESILLENDMMLSEHESCYLI